MSKEILETGLINDDEKQNALINSLKPKLEPNHNTFVYVSKKHGNGAGKYSVSKTTTIDKDIEIELFFFWVMVPLSRCVCFEPAGLIFAGTRVAKSIRFRSSNATNCQTAI